MERCREGSSGWQNGPVSSSHSPNSHQARLNADICHPTQPWGLQGEGQEVKGGIYHL